MNRICLSTVAVLMMMLCGFAFAENKGFCPSAPPASAFRDYKPKVASKPVDTAKQLTVTVLTVVSDTGFVCSAEVLRGVEKSIDDQAVKAVRTWHFDPAKKDGRAVPVIVTVDVSFTRDADGKLVITTPQNDAKSTTNQ